MLPLARRLRSRATSDDGGGATTEGAGKVIFELRADARSGAETGGGTTAGFTICTGALEISRLTEVGAGGITFVASDGAVSVLSRATFGAGATTEVVSVGATIGSRLALGAGGITVGVSAGATRT